MKRNILLAAAVVAIIGAAVLISRQLKPSATTHTSSSRPASSRQQPAAAQSPQHQHDRGGPVAPRVPAFYADAASVRDLGPTLPPEQFFGKTREAYRAAREIPQTIAQLPCYCYCDTSFGHKSLYSCYETDHAAHCAVCVDEALLAYKLQKEQGLTPAQIRERIIAQYSTPTAQH